ncbi:MAG: CPBP family glutamic-type intramembrane protease [Bacteroidota bacterium]
MSLVKEIREVFGKSAGHPFYWMTHACLLLLLYQVLMVLFGTNKVLVYNGYKVWFAFAYKFFPYGTLPISIVLFLVIGSQAFFYWRNKGIPPKKIKKRSKDIWWRDWPDNLAKKYLKPDTALDSETLKSAFEVDWWVFVRIIFQGLIWGAVFYLLLPFLNLYVVSSFLDEDFFQPRPFDVNRTLQKFLTNPLQNFALALGAGFFDELIFRKYLNNFLIERGKKYIKNNALRIFIALFVGAAVYALCHYFAPYGNIFTVYSMFYRFFFALFISWLYLEHGFAIAAWCHVWHDLFYFAFT